MQKLLAGLLILLVLGGGLYAANIVAGTDPQTEEQAASDTAVAAPTTTADATATTHSTAPKENAPAGELLETGVTASGHASITPTIYGDEAASIIIREYASFTCSHCAQFHSTILPELKTHYLDKGDAQLHMYSFIRNEQDLRATMLIQCQPDNKARVKFTRAILSAQEQWAYSADFIENLRIISQIGGFGSEQFTRCMENKELETALLEARQWYVAQLEVESTPFFFIKSARIKGAKDITSFSSILDSLISK